jgi:hypothetical protein
MEAYESDLCYFDRKLAAGLLSAPDPLTAGGLPTFRASLEQGRGTDPFADNRWDAMDDREERLAALPRNGQRSGSLADDDRILDFVGTGLTVREAAIRLFDTPEPSESQKQRARMKLESLADRGLGTFIKGSGKYPGIFQRA